MFENIGSFFKKIMKNDTKELVSDTTLSNASKEAAKERLQLVLMQDRANVSADFLELMKQEIVDVIKKYIVVEEDIIDVRIINQENEDGTQGAPSLCANIPILNIRNDNKGEKFRNEQAPTITKENDTEDSAKEESINDSNDNVEIEKNVEEKTDVNLENDIVEISEEIVEEEKSEAASKTVVDSEIEEFEQIKNISAEENEDVVETVIEENSEDNIQDIEKEIEEDIEELDNYDEEDDDDVTFDDLLKAAEEEEKNQKAKEAEKPKNDNKKKNTKSKGKSSKNNNKRKQTNKK